MENSLQVPQIIKNKPVWWCKPVIPALKKEEDH
jgi:hypothetical protein